TRSKRDSSPDVCSSDRVRVLYADFDYKDGASQTQISDVIDQLSEQIGARPISVVFSGGGFHPRWKLAKPIETDDAKGVLGRWQQIGRASCRERVWTATW